MKANSGERVQYPAGEEAGANKKEKMNPNSKLAKWFPLWIGNVRRECIGKPLIFKAMYLNLMMALWESGGQIPDDEESLMITAEATPEQWIKHRQALANLFVPRHGAWTHNLLRVELEKAHKISTVKSEASKKGNQKRWADTHAAKAETAEVLKRITEDGTAL